MTPAAIAAGRNLAAGARKGMSMNAGIRTGVVARTYWDAASRQPMQMAASSGRDPNLTEIQIAAISSRPYGASDPRTPVIRICDGASAKSHSAHAPARSPKTLRATSKSIVPVSRAITQLRNCPFTGFEPKT